ncbi:MAG: right-handed parallel beta-helix repeat-containing protein, partial [Thermoplasmata archaeon]
DGNNILDNLISSNTNASIELIQSNSSMISGNDISNGNYGIYLWSSSNSNTISSNNITSNNQRGILFKNSSNSNTISDNEITLNDHYGIEQESSSGNTISDNNITSNIHDGIRFVNSSDNTISGNILSDSNYGIAFHSSSNNNTILNNEIFNNNYGITFWVSNDNKISGCNITSNNEYGIKFQSSIDNTISGNDISMNGVFGVYFVLDSDTNTISDNYIISNNNDGIYLDSSDSNNIQYNTISGETVIDEKGLVGFWKMDEPTWSGVTNEVVDFTRYGNHGTANGNANTANGRFDRAGDFDGDLDYVGIPSSNSLEISEDITIEGWINVNGPQNDRTGIIHKFHSDAGNYYGYRIRMNSPSQLIFEYGDGTPVISGLYSLGQVEQYNWHHFAATKEGTQMKIFIDGMEVSTGTGRPKIGTGPTWLDIGHSFYNNQSFNGKIDEVKIYNRALSNQEILERYHISKNGIMIVSSTRNTIGNNTICKNGEIGIYLKDSSNTKISDNNITSNGYIAVNLETSDGNTVTYNNITSNMYYGFRLTDSNNNEIYLNDIINNTIQAVDDGGSNSWDNGTDKGNYWSDWTSPDTNPGDGIVDIPRSIDGSGSVDNYPIADPQVWTGWGPVYNLDKNTYHKTISDGVGLASESNRIWVSAGIYYEYVEMDQKLTLMGQDRERTTIDGEGIDAIQIRADGIVVRGFTIKDSSGMDMAGIKIDSNIDSSSIIDVYCSNNKYGIYLDSNSFNINIKDSVFTQNEEGIHLESSNSNEITGNYISSNIYGGVNLHSSTDNFIMDNVINSNNRGIDFYGSSSGNQIIKNRISNNIGEGLYLRTTTSYNLIYHNNIIGNNPQTFDDGNKNLWNVSYPTGGNYWSDYSGWDNYSGPAQDMPGSDGFGDTNYTIDADSSDQYPLMIPMPYYPYKPQNLKSTPGDYNVHLSWDPPGYDGGLEITSYTIYRYILAGEETLIATLGNVHSFNDTTVLGGEVHYYVRAVNAMGEGDSSDTVSAIPNYISPMFQGNARHTGLSLYNTSDIDGALKWSYDAGSSVYSSPAIGNDGTIYIGTYGGDLIALNPDGSEKWSYN